MPSTTGPEIAVLREWLRNRTAPTATPQGEDLVPTLRAVLDALPGTPELPDEVLFSGARLLFAARAELDRIELGLMRAASERRISWTVIAQVFGYRSKQAAHARASALHHRLEYQTAQPGGH